MVMEPENSNRDDIQLSLDSPALLNSRDVIVTNSFIDSTQIWGKRINIKSDLKESILHILQQSFLELDWEYKPYGIFYL